MKPPAIRLAKSDNVRCVPGMSTALAGCAAGTSRSSGAKRVVARVPGAAAVAPDRYALVATILDARRGETYLAVFRREGAHLLRRGSDRALGSLTTATQMRRVLMIHYNFPPLGENLIVGAPARPNELTYSEDWLRPDYVPPASDANRPTTPPTDQASAPVPPVLPAEAPTNPNAGLAGMMVPPGAGS